MDESSKPKSKRRRWIVILLLVGVPLALLSWLTFSDIGPPDETPMKLGSLPSPQPVPNPLEEFVRRHGRAMDRFYEEYQALAIDFELKYGWSEEAAWKSAIEKILHDHASLREDLWAFAKEDQTLQWSGVTPEASRLIGQTEVLAAWRMMLFMRSRPRFSCGSSPNLTTTACAKCLRRNRTTCCLCPSRDGRG